MYFQSQILAIQKEYRQGEMVIQRAIQVAPNDLDVLSRMSKLLGMQGKHEEVRYSSFHWLIMNSEKWGTS